MSHSIKVYMSKIETRRHALIRLFQPFHQTIQSDIHGFIPELPESNGFGNILVVMDKLTKYGIS